MPTPPRVLTHDNETLPLAEWSARTGLTVATIRSRLDRLSWSVDRALTTPADRRFRRGGRPRVAEPRVVPRLRRHEASGRAFARWWAGGKDMCRYFGAWGSQEAKDGYRRFAVEWAAGSVVGDGPAGADLGVGELIVRRLRWAELEYVKGGKPTSEMHCQRAALRVVAELYGALPAAEFDPPKLRAVRQAMIDKGWCRGTINLHVSRVIAAFRWAAAEGWLPAAVPAALRELGGLKAGKTIAPDRPRKKPVPDAEVAAVLPHLSPVPARRAKLAAMVAVQRLTGMRPGEVCALRPRDLDRSGAVWKYVVADAANKNLHRSKPQSYYLGPRVQAELSPYLGGDADSPAFGVTRHAYWLAVRTACKQAGVRPWHPHQLRHTLADEVARELGSVDAAAAAIGDTPDTAARHYVHCDPKEVAKIEWAKRKG